MHIGWLAKVIVAAVTCFVATNIDDFIILTIFYSQVSPTFRPKHILIGQYLGFGALILLSLPGFFGGLVISRSWIGLLGFMPIAIGIHTLVSHSKHENHVQTTSSQFYTKSPLASFLAPQTYHVAAVTFANGGDNIGTYIPLFASTNFVGLGVTLSTFFLLVAVWCYVAHHLTRYAPLANVLTRYGKSVVPYVLMGLGLYILFESETYKLLPIFAS
ncbi:Cadmium resistance transporter [Tumidithrix helvetica PCC 7403]|uniref:cadmium resistance transporter n=1 Tax=Tumidithrix helvetica TaxID=3457545 RepID=UPI003C8EC3D5